jgi:hypothetical protein
MPDRDYAYEGGGIKPTSRKSIQTLDAATQITIAETGRADTISAKSS